MKPNFYNKGQQHELILKQDVQNLGFKDDVVTVKMVMVVIFYPTRSRTFNFFQRKC
jgi:hypothetical protein